jgi:hypothetical protein
MPLIDRRIGRQTIEVTPAVDVPEPNSKAMGEDYIERLVITRAGSSAQAHGRIHGLIL